ncbi:unnamed protein product [Ceutorhynchus assimilis]|uniref:E3 ubiquitin-protein ligase NRDP1 n=1 Tax=Ceutorhynchus assimilis TaxID=467358 RepID=A0A9N9MBM3_9CUCU|nr:unnamed protein product [Ceutorhynchus assimilis]
MGYEVTRFQGEVDDELICPICSAVFEDPIQAHECEHIFCNSCITRWISEQPTCPVDRKPLTASLLTPVPRILRNLLAKLTISCDNAEYGCSRTLGLETLTAHLKECLHNPKRPVVCDQGCGLIVPKDELKDHNCIRELRTLITKQQQQMDGYQHEVHELHFFIMEQRRDMQVLKDFLRSLKMSHPSVRAMAEAMERDQQEREVLRWSNSLQRARVTRWGGMISTPDEALQRMIKRTLTEIGCPDYILEDLMGNCHECRWPPGLSTLETRQSNRRQYENYVCKRVPGKQAVLVLQCDNPHMNDDLMNVPGLVMIFAHGVE